MLQNSPKEEQGETIERENPSPNHEIQSEFHENLGSTDCGEEEVNAKFKDAEDKFEDKISSTKSENSVSVEDDDGFRTPTSIEHKIPAITECPPAPTRKRPLDSKLMTPPPLESYQRAQFVATAEAHALLSRMIGDHAGSTKRARTVDDEF